MKLKHILPVTLLAVLALAACDPVDSTSDTSSEEELTLASYVDDLAVGVQAEGVLEDILALLPAADVGFTTQTQDYLEYSSADNYQLETSVVASRYDNDVLEVVLDSQVAERVDGVWGEFAPYYSSIETVWADATNINYVYEEDGDPLNAYSFALAADANAEVLDGYLASVGAVVSGSGSGRGFSRGFLCAAGYHSQHHAQNNHDRHNRYDFFVHPKVASSVLTSFAYRPNNQGQSHR